MLQVLRFYVNDEDMYVMGLKKSNYTRVQIGELLHFYSILSVLDKNIYIHFLSYQLQSAIAEQNRLMPSRQVVVLGYARIP